MAQKIVDSKAYPLKELFSDKFDVDFYQREYVWQRKQLEDLITDLSSEFLKSWNANDSLESIRDYDPYFMGEIVLSLQEGKRSSIIDGQQRITTFTILLIYLRKTFGDLDSFPRSDIEQLIYSDDYGTKRFNLDIEERKDCMLGLYKNGVYIPKESDPISVTNIVSRYDDLSECWDKRIDDSNAVAFTYWLMNKVIFSKVWTNSDDFAYVIFETMNDRGLSLTQVEMLRSYLLANIKPEDREKSMNKFDDVIKCLISIKLNSKSKAEFEFFKMYFRSHLANDLSQAKNNNSDFTRIGKEFHRWIRDNSKDIGLNSSDDYVRFIDYIAYYSKVYSKIYELINDRNTKDYLYLVVNSDYGFTLQPAVILAAVKYQDSDEIILEKLKIVSKYLTKVLSWRVWNHWVISQSSLEAPIYDLCKKIRSMNVDTLQNFLAGDPIELPKLDNSPTLNQQNKPKLRVLISLITEIVAVNSGTPDYMLNKPNIDVEHIWSDHYDQHTDDCKNESEFAVVRNNIGDLLVLPKSFNSSYNDDPYSVKVIQYFEQNILAQTLNANKYKNNPAFLNFKEVSSIPFKSYENFDRTAIEERANLYRSILLWNWNEK